MHKYDVAYRNLKPENIMIDDKGHIKLIGFSCAKVTEISCSTSIDIPHNLTIYRGHTRPTKDFRNHL